MRASIGLDNAAAKRLNEFFRAFAGAIQPLLLLDYDGTLAPFRVDRFKAQPWAGIRTLLNRIQSQERTHMVVVTGRPAAEIAPLLGVNPAPEVWGLHGSERLHADGRRELEQVPAAACVRLKALCEQLHRDSFGALFEEKANAAAMHWRGISAAESKTIEKRTRELFEPLARMEGLSLLEFEAGLELRAGRDKGEAVKALLKETCNNVACPAAYLGDDLTDEAAFGAIKGHGLGVLVRRQQRPTEADVWLRPPQELRAFLKRWWQACRGLEMGALAGRSGGLGAGHSEGREGMADRD